MSSDSRRQFLKTGLATAAAMAVPASIRQAMAIPAHNVTGTLRDVEHIVVLMQENRSFDHYFGTLNGVRGFGDPRPAPLPSGRPVWYQSVGRNGASRTGYQNVGWDHWHERAKWYEADPAAQAKLDYVLPFRLDTGSTNAQHMGGTDHSWKLDQSLWKTWDTWVPLKSRMSMGFYDTASDLPFYRQLADAFTVCDANHCSIFANTEPNRQYFTGGASVYTLTGRDPANPKRRLHGQELDNNWTGDMDLDEPWEGLAWEAYAETLEKHGIDWRVYQAFSNYGCNSLAYHRDFRKISKSSDLYKRGRAYVGPKLASNEDPYDAVLARAIADDVKHDRLPQVSWVICPDAYCEHPSASPAAGQAFVDKILEALTSNPKVWAKTALIVNYDENDGFFDHVPAPVPPVNTRFYGYQGRSTVPTGDENFNGVPIGLGPRVPMLVVSPWSKGGWVCSELFDHTSVLQFIEQRFGVPCRFISPWRRSVCGDLTAAFDFRTPDAALPPLPDTSRYKAEADAAAGRPKPVPPATPSRPVQQRGQRRARPLPYRLSAQGRVDPSGQRFWIDFANAGSAGACFIVYGSGGATFNETGKPYEPDDTVLPDRPMTATADRRGPWQYTIGAGDALSDSWTPDRAGSYDLSVYGPNGMLNQFKGRLSPILSGTARPEVRLIQEGLSGDVTLLLSNLAFRPCTLTVSNGYSSEPPRRHTLLPGALVLDRWSLRSSSGWFDLSVTAGTGDGFLRRFAGHVETGRASLTDPKIGGPSVETI